MSLIIFLPALLCIACIWRWGAEKALRYVCIPTMLLLPTYFYWKTEGVPGIDFVMAPLIPLGLSMLAMLPARWRFTRSDFWLVLYVVSCAYADLRSGETSLANYRFFDAIFTALVPYMAGKILIERGAGRLETVKCIILSLVGTCILALPEAPLKINLSSREWLHLFPDQNSGWGTQLRWGLGRVAGPCGSPELFGLILVAVVPLLLWLRRTNAASDKVMREDWTSSRPLTLLLLAVLFLTLFLTESRGPWIGTALALIIASLGRTSRVKRAAMITFVVCALAAVPMYRALSSYVSGPRTQYGSVRETAQYRRELLIRYIPLAEQGGAWGWGTFYPILGGQTSIDNEYLRVYVSQGYVGVLSYLLLIFEAGIVLVRAGFRARRPEDRHFYFTMLGMLSGIVLTVFTVFMGGQTYEFFFLLIGWTQGISRTPSLAADTSEEREPVALRLNRIYT